MPSSFVAYSKKIGVGPDDGATFACSKTSHIVLFDRPSSTSRGKGSEEIESPILARFKSTIESAARACGDKGFKVRLLVIHAPQQEKAKEGVHNNICSLCKFVLGRRQKYMFSPWMEQIKNGYNELAKYYVVNDLMQERDSVLLFGDGEGVMAAIEAARLITKVGVLQSWAFNEKGTFNTAFSYATDTSYDEDDLYCFRQFRARYAKVELLGLWCDDSRASQISKAIGNNKALRDKSVQHNCTKCKFCQTSGDTSCTIDSMILTLRSECPYIPYIAQ